jgi:hypothetical protein
MRIGRWLLWHHINLLWSLLDDSDLLAVGTSDELRLGLHLDELLIVDWHWRRCWDVRRHISTWILNLDGDLTASNLRTFTKALLLLKLLDKTAFDVVFMLFIFLDGLFHFVL